MGNLQALMPELRRERQASRGFTGNKLSCLAFVDDSVMKKRVTGIFSLKLVRCHHWHRHDHFINRFRILTSALVDTWRWHHPHDLHLPPTIDTNNAQPAPALSIPILIPPPSTLLPYSPRPHTPCPPLPPPSTACTAATVNKRSDWKKERLCSLTSKWRAGRRGWPRSITSFKCFLHAVGDTRIKRAAKRRGTSIGKIVIQLGATGNMTVI